MKNFLHMMVHSGKGAVEHAQKMEIHVILMPVVCVVLGVALSLCLKFCFRKRLARRKYQHQIKENLQKSQLDPSKPVSLDLMALAWDNNSSISSTKVPIFRNDSSSTSSDEKSHEKNQEKNQENNYDLAPVHHISVAPY